MKPRAIECAAAVLGAAATTFASTVVTQSSDRSNFGLWLGDTGGQQSIAHQQVHAEHDLVIVEVFSAESMKGADVVYISPSWGGSLVLSEDEKAALRAYAESGGRIIAIGDHTIFAEDIGPFAADYDVFYGELFLDGFQDSIIHDAENPLFDGPAGVVKAFRGAGANDDLRSKNEDFQVIASWDDGPPGVGYLPVGQGEIVFLSDFNTFDDDMINDFDNNVFWRNLFLRPDCSADIDGNRAIDFDDLLAVLDAWGDAGGPEDLDGSGTVDFGDLLLVLEGWGRCR